MLQFGSISYLAVCGSYIVCIVIFVFWDNFFLILPYLHEIFNMLCYYYYIFES